jgi:hypothetical protein
MSLKVLTAARAACLAGAIAAAHASPSFAGSAYDETAMGARQSSAVSGLRLNLSMLENRIRETRAISVLQKLALQQDVDDLLARIRAAHRARV